MTKREPLQKAFCSSPSLILCFGFNRVNADQATIFTASFKSNLAGNFCIDGVIFTHAYVLTHMETGTTLTNDDGTSSYQLTIMSFRTQTLCVGVTAVVGGTRTFFMGV